VHSDDSGNYFVIISRADSHGNDYARITLFTFEECQNSCKADKGCNAFTYNQAASVCFLKSAANQWTNFYAWATTGIRVASLQPEEKSANTAPAESQVNSPSEQAQVPQPPPAPSQPQVVTPSEQKRFPQPTAENEAGRMLLQKNCSRCHSIDATGQSPLQLAPPLREIYLRYPIEQLEYGFAEGMGSKHREMPQIQFSSVQVSAILSYLGSITGVAPSARTRAATPSETQPP
jgi:mono/diheme cytochrome c family protein